MASNLYAILFEIHQEPLEYQKARLLQELEDWMLVGNEPQVDDITLVGVRLGEGF